MRERRGRPELEPKYAEVRKQCLRCHRIGKGYSFKPDEVPEDGIVKVRGCTACAKQTAAELKALTVRPKRDNPDWTQK